MGLFDAASLFVETGAKFDGAYRYTLFRDWSQRRGAPYVAWLMLNPSTADKNVLDPTLRRCAGYTAAWGFERFEVVNLFAYRATDPDDMVTAALAGVDPIGPHNDANILDTCTRAGLVICGWGTNIERKPLLGRDRHVLRLLRSVRLSALKITDGGHPQHPLYLASDLKPSVWRGAAS